MKRYEKLAHDIAHLIQVGTIQAGERIPSVRQAAAAWQVSASTVIRAYSLLENQGFIQAKQQSGYYVLPRATSTVQPHKTKFAGVAELAIPTTVKVSELVFSLLDSVRDLSIVPLGSAFPNPQLFPLQRITRLSTQALRVMPANALIIDMPLGVPQLRRSIAHRYALADITVHADDILITTGAMEALNLCLQTVTQPNDYVVIESPAFYASLQVLERLQLKAIEIPVDEDGINLKLLVQALQQYPVKACWLMSSFQNPTGISFSDRKKQQLLELLLSYQIPLIEDDVYHELHFGTQVPKPIKAFDQQGWVMHCSSFSKCLAPGYRIGWVNAGRFSQQIQRLKLMTTISPSIPSQFILAEYLQHGDYERHLRKLRQQLYQQYQLMIEAIQQFFPASTVVSQPTGGYFLWVQLESHIDSLLICQQALTQGISVAPGPMFSASQGFKNCLRLNYGAPTPAQIATSIEILGQLIRAQLV